MDGSVDIRLDPNTGFLADPGARAVCAALADAGYRALFVGGCVRNALLRAPASDIDIATDATPDAVTRAVTAADLRAVPTGVAHGTVTVVVGSEAYEVTTFRRDVATDGRRAVVAFSTDMTEDARRRDFTMNALYADADGRVFDPLGGVPDLRAGRVRFIEDATRRIREDYLRTLRFFRFSAYYGAADAGWDSAALDAIGRTLDGLSTLSAERIGAEMRTLLAAPDPVPALHVMAQVGVLNALLPGADPVLLGPFVHVQTDAGVPIDPMGRLAALGGADVADRLRLSRKDKTRLEAIRTHAASPLPHRALGQVAGAAAGAQAAILRAAMAQRTLAPGCMDEIAEGALRTFPVAAADLPHLTGAELGAALTALRQAWLASDLTLSKTALLRS